MANLHCTSQAEVDLLEIWEFIAEDDPGAADRLLDQIDTACQMLVENPNLGSTREDLAPGLRFFPVGNNLIFYLLKNDEIVVVRVLHGARDYPREFR